MIPDPGIAGSTLPAVAERAGIEPASDGVIRRLPVLKTGWTTRSILSVVLVKFGLKALNRVQGAYDTGTVRLFQTGAGLPPHAL